jgi:hypothetical protein
VLTTAAGGAGVSLSASPSLTINQGQSTNLTASAATSYSWSTGQTTPTISVSLAGTYSVTGTLGSCSSVTSVVVNVLDTPTIIGFAASPNPVVTSQPVLFTATVGNFSGSYSYTLSNGSSTTTSTSSNPAFSYGSIASISSPQNYTLTVVNNNRPPGWATVSLTVVNGLTWTGNTSTDWNTASNWYPAKVPVVSDNLTIPAAPANQPVISTTAVAYSVMVSSGASLSITVGGSLSINGSRSVALGRIAIYNLGTVTSKGQLVIGNTTYAGEYGLVNSGGAFSNNSGGIITINRTSETALYNQSGNFTNSGKINIGTITTVGNYGLYNQATFANTGCGALINVVANARITDAGSGTLTNSGTIIENASLSSNITNNSGMVRNLNGSSFTIANNTGVLTTAPGSAGVSISVSPSLTINQGQSATLTASGAASYNWSSGQSTTAISVSVAGTYSVTGTLGSCTSVTSVVVRAPISLTTSASPNTICMGGSVALSVTTKGSSSPYSYSWVAPAGITLSATNASAVTGIASTSLSGVKTFTVSVAGSDDMPISTSTVSITVNVPPTASISPLSATLTCANPTRNLIASGGATYRWDNNVTTSIRSVSVAGTYSVTVTSANGCTATASRTITSNTTPPTASISPSIGTPTGATLTCATPTVSLTASGETTYRWENNTTTSIRSVSLAGTYSVTVTGANGCTATASFSVTSNTTTPTASISPSSATLTCASPTVSLTASGASTYRWNNNATTAIRSVSVAGTYSVTVTAANGCTATTSRAVFSNTTVASITNPTITTATQGVGFSQNFTAQGGIPPYSFSLSGGTLPAGLILATSGVLSGTPSQNGSFTVTVQVQTGNGCLAQSGVYSLTVRAVSGSFVSVKAGQWTDPSVWSAGRVPVAGDEVTVLHAVVIPANVTATVLRLRYGTGGQLKYGNPSTRLQIGF